MSTICVDAGTSMIKAVVFGADGRERAVARSETEVRQPRPGWSEQDMDHVWQAVVAAVREVRDQVDDTLDGAVDCLSFTGQGDGCWLIDSAGRPTGTALLWNDGRAGPIVQQWSEQGVLDAAFRISGSLTNAGLPNAQLTWLLQNEPERVDRAAAALYCDGWLFHKFTGAVAEDASDAANPLLDIRSGEYSPELLRLFGLEAQARLLPEVLGDDQRVGQLTSSAANELDLPAGLPVVLAPYDIAATALGVGAVEPGQACSILGTTLCTEVVTAEVQTDTTAAGLTVPLGHPGRYLRAFPTLAGTEVINWALRLLGVSDEMALADLAAQARPGALPVLLPYLSPAGERAPFLDARARGSLLGLSLASGRAEVARAVFDGLTMVVRDCLAATAVEVDELRVCGGGAASDFWCQLIADVVGVPVLRSADSEAGAKGAFLYGLVATGAVPDLGAAAASYVRVETSFRPSERLAGSYREGYERFLELRRLAATTWPLLAAGPEATPPA